MVGKNGNLMLKGDFRSKVEILPNFSVRASLNSSPENGFEMKRTIRLSLKRRKKHTFLKRLYGQYLKKPI